MFTVLMAVISQSEAWTVFARLNPGVVGSNSTRAKDVSVCVVFVCKWWAHLPSKESYGSQPILSETAQYQISWAVFRIVSCALADRGTGAILYKLRYKILNPQVSFQCTLKRYPFGNVIPGFIGAGIWEVVLALSRFHPVQSPNAPLPLQPRCSRTINAPSLPAVQPA
jgi:hypothetical protein